MLVWEVVTLSLWLTFRCLLLPDRRRFGRDVRHRRRTDHRAGLLFFVKMQEMEAIGTSLAALIPPVGLLGG